MPSPLRRPVRPARPARRVRRVRAAVATAGVTVLLAVGLAACTTQPAVNRRPHTGSTTASVANGLQQVTVTAGDTDRFDPSTITVHPGAVHLVLVNDGSGKPHDWTLLGLPAAHTTLIGGGVSTSVTFTAPAPGKYTFVCTVHQKQGQTGTLVVLGQ
jgi:plastocyanin